MNHSNIQAMQKLSFHHILSQNILYVTKIGTFSSSYHNTMNVSNQDHIRKHVQLCKFVKNCGKKSSSTITSPKVEIKMGLDFFKSYINFLEELPC